MGEGMEGNKPGYSFSLVPLLLLFFLLVFHFLQ